MTPMMGTTIGRPSPGLAAGGVGRPSPTGVAVTGVGADTVVVRAWGVFVVTSSLSLPLVPARFWVRA